MGFFNTAASFRLLLMIAWFNSLNSNGSLSRQEKHPKQDGYENFNRDFTGVYFDPSDFKMYNALPQKLDDTALATLLKVINTRFDNVLVALHVPHRHDGDVSNDLFPEVIARHNQLLNDSQSSTVSTRLKVDIICKSNGDNWNNEEAIHSRLQEIKKVVNDANSIYSGTVNNVILELADLNENSIKNFKMFLSNVGAGNKVGVKLKLEICVNSLSSETSISQTSMIDLLTLNDNSLGTVMFEESFDPTVTSVSVSQALNILQSQFSRCQELLHNLKKKLEFVLITSWSDIDDKGQQRYSEFEDFWARVNKWAAASNTSVIFRQAFDTPLATGTLTMKTNGWWRLIPNSSYLQPFQFVFEEKASIIHNDETRKKSERDKMTWLKQPAEFSRSVVGVNFNPFVMKSEFEQSTSEIEASLLPLIQRVFSKFSKILISTVFTDYDLSSRYSSPKRNKQILFGVPNAVAKWNKNQSRNAKKSMELILTFHENTAEMASRSASAANQLFPGTVAQLIYSPMTFDEDKFLDNLVALAKISNKINVMRFGIKINLKLCNDHLKLRKVMDLLRDYFPEDLKINIIYFESLVLSEPSKLRADRFLPLLTVMFENCKKSVYDYLERSQCNKNAEVAFITGWPITNEDPLEGLVQSTLFWEGISTWAATSNTTVILYSTFDPVTSSSSIGRRNARYGWWSVRLNSTLGEHYSFEDNKIAALRFALEKQNNDSNDFSQLVTIIVPSVAAVISIVFLALLIVFYLLKRRQSDILTNEEIAQFFNGGESNIYTGSPENMSGPYQKLHLEIPTKSFTINEESLLGSGEYGKVCLGTVKRNGGVDEDVAVKMTQVPSTRFALRGLLFEIKILSYLGKHPHVVEMVGAYTAELRKSKVFVFLEFCGLGSLQSYLTKYKSPTKYDSDDVSDQLQLDCEDKPEELDDALVCDMARWSCEIAKGMEFIAAKHIVHLDIATRNVLLTLEKRAKITDFGLSRRMYEYQSYIKKHQEPLPWRSMAPESLRRSEFTEKSDVWAFGMLLWEIYSLGDEPYPGLSWHVNFPTKLERGLRPGEPTYNRNSMYSIMLRCWTTNPAGRPTFSELVLCLNPSIVEAGPSGSHSVSTAPIDENVNMSESTCTKTVSKTSNEKGNGVAPTESTSKKKDKIICPGVRWMWSLLAFILLLILLNIPIWSPWMTGGLVISATASNGTTSALPPMVGHRNLTTILNNNQDVKNESRKTAWPYPQADLGRNKCKDARNRTALGHKLFTVISRRWNNKEALSLLLQLGADVNVRDELGQTPLIAAANCSEDKDVCVRIIEKLIEHGANVTSRGNKGETFLYKLVSEPGNIKPTQFHEIVVYLISQNMSELFNEMGLHKKSDSLLPLWWLSVWNMEVENRTLSLLFNKTANFQFEIDTEIGTKRQILAVATVARRSPRLLSFLIKLGANLGYLNHFNDTLLHTAASWCYADGVIFFLHKGLDINAPNKFGLTSLHMAASCPSESVEETIRILIENGAKVNVKGNDGATPLDVVNEREDFHDEHNVVQLLQDAECNQDQTNQDPLPEGGNLKNGQLILYAIDQRKYCTLRNLVDSGVDINIYIQNITLLMRLAKTCGGTCFRIITYLIKNDADVYAEDMAGNTFLHHLLAHEVHGDASKFRDIVSLAVSNNFSKLFNLKRREFPNDSLIQWVLRDTSVDMDTLTLLHQNAVDFNTKNLEGDSIISSAVNGSLNDVYAIELISNLIKLGVDWTGLYKQNRSLLHISAGAGNTDAVKLFLNKGLDINAQDSDGETPLHLAVRYVSDSSLVEVVQLLIDNGANGRIKNGDGEAPFSIVCDRGHRAVTAMLRIFGCGNIRCCMRFG